MQVRSTEPLPFSVIRAVAVVVVVKKFTWKKRVSGVFDAKSRKIRRIAQPTTDSDAVNKLSMEKSIKLLRGSWSFSERYVDVAKQRSKDIPGVG